MNAPRTLLRNRSRPRNRQTDSQGAGQGPRTQTNSLVETTTPQRALPLLRQPIQAGSTVHGSRGAAGPRRQIHQGQHRPGMSRVQSKKEAGNPGGGSAEEIVKIMNGRVGDSFKQKQLRNP